MFDMTGEQVCYCRVRGCCKCNAYWRYMRVKQSVACLVVTTCTRTVSLLYISLFHTCAAALLVPPYHFKEIYSSRFTTNFVIICSIFYSQFLRFLFQCVVYTNHSLETCLVHIYFREQILGTQKRCQVYFYALHLYHWQLNGIFVLKTFV